MRAACTKRDNTPLHHDPGYVDLVPTICNPLHPGYVDLVPIICNPLHPGYVDLEPIICNPLHPGYVDLEPPYTRVMLIWNPLTPGLC